MFSQKVLNEVEECISASWFRKINKSYHITLLSFVKFQTLRKIDGTLDQIIKVF